jgi:hypothetical protein
MFIVSEAIDVQLLGYIVSGAVACFAAAYAAWKS